MTIVFILNSYGKSRYDKRVEEFIRAGYDIEVYAFKRFEGDLYKSSFPVEIIGHFDNTVSYYRRNQLIFKAVKQLLRNHKKQRVLYYLFGLDVALSFYLIHNNEPYVYEEGDLVHTYMHNTFLRNTLEFFDKKIIRRSKLTVFTSEGFPKYHFCEDIDNSVIVPNKISKKILELHKVEKNHVVDINHLSIGFVGAPRFEKVLSFLDVACRCFPQHKFHIFGGPVPDDFTKLEAYTNMTFHGPFKTPEDLPNIYSNLDLVLSTYDTDSDNVRYAEPNKLYEAIYFETPIIVSQGTFLGEKVNRLGIGYELDVTDANVIDFFNKLTLDVINRAISNIKRIPKEFAINDGSELFSRINKVMDELQ